MPATEPPPVCPIVMGESFGALVRYSREEIARFARDTGDANPVHHDEPAARRAHHGGLIASGQQTAARMMGLVATHFSRSDDGLAREMLCLNFNFSFKAPVFPDQVLTLSWQVQQINVNDKLGGWVGELTGEARRDDGLICVVGRATVLVKHQAAAPDAG